MKNAFFSSLIQGADGCHGGGAGFFYIAGFDCQASSFDRPAGGAAEYAVAGTSFYVLAIAFNRRFCVCQGKASKSCFVHG